MIQDQNLDKQTDPAAQPIDPDGDGERHHQRCCHRTGGEKGAAPDGRPKVRVREQPNVVAETDEALGHHIHDVEEAITEAIERWRDQQEGNQDQSQDQVSRTDQRDKPGPSLQRD
jgi:hypothetical protein